MDIHKPKPVHNVREFLKEVGIIVLGVCIALAAEQAVETAHAHSRAAGARASIRAEIAYNLGWMDIRKATEPCISRRLDEIDALIAAWAAGKPSQEVLWIGRPVNIAGRDSQYKSLSQSGSVNLLSDREQAGYAAVYFAFDLYTRTQVDELKAWADLRTLERHPPPSATLDWQLRSAMQQARNARFLVESSRRVFMTAAAELGIQPAPSLVYKMQSVCVPLHTPRAEAVKMVIQGRPGHFVYDEP